MKRQYPSQARLRELFDYDDEAGRLVWRFNPLMAAWWNARFSNKMVGCLSVSSQLSQKFVIVINKTLYSGAKLLWIYHFGDVPNGKEVSRIDTYAGFKIDNLEIRGNSRKGQIHRSHVARMSAGHKGVSRPRHASWLCVEPNQNSTFFLTEISAATHYDNVCETTHGIRPNGTEKENVDQFMINLAAARHRQNAEKAIKENGIVGVLGVGKKFQARFDKKHIGTFPTKEEAALAYNKAAYAKYGELAILNDLLPF